MNAELMLNFESVLNSGELPYSIVIKINNKQMIVMGKDKDRYPLKSLYLEYSPRNLNSKDI